MDKRESACKYTGIDRDYSVADLAAFHGHLGPYIVLGYRIGSYAKKNFCSDPFQMKAVVFCEGVPPQSCLADGIQIGSGCTLGKRNIEISVSDSLAVEFYAEDKKKKIVIRPRSIAFPKQEAEDEDKDKDSERLIEMLAEDMYSMADSELFSVEIETSRGSENAGR